MDHRWITFRVEEIADGRATFTMRQRYAANDHYPVYATIKDEVGQLQKTSRIRRVDTSNEEAKTEFRKRVREEIQK